MKNSICKILVMAFVLVCTAFLSRGCVRVSFRNVDFGVPVDGQTNYIQYSAATKLSVCNSQLYISPQEDLYLHHSGRRFYALNKGSLHPVKDYDQTRNELAIKDNTLYYRRFDSVRQEHCIYAYDLLTGKEHFITDIYGTVVQNTRGELFFRLYIDDRPVFHPIDGIHLKAVVDSMEPKHMLGGYTYTVEGNRVICYTPTGERLDLGSEFQSKDIIPCEKGLLLVEKYCPTEVYLIQEPGMEPLLLADHSAFLEGGIAVYETSVFLSYTSRLERLKNDVGIYRIDLENLSCEKISDVGYNGLYIFDNSGIFACTNDGSIVKLDWNGKVAQTLLKEVAPWDISILLPLIGILSTATWGVFRLKRRLGSNNAGESMQQ